MQLSHITSIYRQQDHRPLAVFFGPRRPRITSDDADARYGHCGGLRALRQPHMALHSRVPPVFGPHKAFAARVQALHVRIHTFYLKFLQGHT